MVFNLIDNESNKIGKEFNFSLFGLLDNKDNSDSKIFKQLSNDIIKLGVDSKEVTNKLAKLSQTSTQLGLDIATAKKPVKEISQDFLLASKNLNKTSISSKAAAVGMKALNMAMNIGVMLAVSAAINLIVKGLDYLINKQQKAIEKANEITQAWKDQQQELSDNKNKIDEISKEYEKLATGVDQFGNNISLTTEQYARYNDIVNQIAEMFPVMVAGYTSEGNAIIKNKGNVEELTKAYREQKQAMQDTILLGASDAWKGFSAYGADSRWDNNGKLSQVELAKDIIDNLNDTDKLKSIISNIGENGYGIGTSIYKTGFLNLLKESGFDSDQLKLGDWDNAVSIIQKNSKKIEAFYRQTVSNLNVETAKVKPILDVLLDTDYKFQSLDDETQGIIKNLSSLFDYSFFFKFDDERVMYSWITENLIEPLSNPATSQEVKNAIQTLLDTDNVNLPSDQYQQLIENALASLPEELQSQIRLYLNFDIVTDGMKEQLKEKVGDIDTSELSIGDIKVVLNPDFKFDPKGKTLSEQIKDFINADSPSITFDLDIISDNLTEFNTEIEKIYTKFDILKKAEEEFSKTGKITADTFKSLSDNNLIQYLNFTSDGLNVLTDDLSKNEEALKKKAKADIDAAFYSDMLALAISGETDEQKKAKELAKDSGNAAMTAGEQFAHSATGIMTAATAMEIFNKVAKGEDIDGSALEGKEEQFQHLIDLRNKAMSAIDSTGTSSSETISIFIKQLDDITNKTSVLGTAWKEMNEAGKLSTATITKLIETDEDWEKSLDIVNGKVIINKETLVQSAKEIINAKKVKTQAMIDDSEKQIEALKNTALAQLNMSQMFSKLNGFSGADIDKYYDEQKLLIENNKLTGKKLEDLNKLEQDIAECNKHMEIFNALENDLSSDDPFGILGDSASKLKSQLSSMNSAVNSLFSTTAEMLKKGYELKKQGIQDEIDALNKQHDLNSESLDKNLEDSQKAYEKQKKFLEDKLKLLEAERDARLKALQVLKDEYDWQKKLDDHNKTIADLKTRLQTAELDDSETGKALVKDLKQQLADAENALKDDQFDKDIDRQENAINDEFDKAKELYDNKLDLLDKEQQVLEDSHKIQLERIEKEYQSKKENLEKQIKDIEDYLSTEVGIRNEALALIDEGSQDFYDRLIEYNTLYGDGVNQNVRNMWNNAYISLDKFNAGQRTTLDILGELSEAMNDFAKEIGMAVDKADSLSRALGNVDQSKSNITIPNNTASPSSSSSSSSNSSSSKPSFDIFGELGSLFGNLFGDMEIHHSGADSGFVGGVVPKLKENEKFAKLLKGELVINKNDMNSLLNNIPNIALSGINNIAQNFYKTIPNIPAAANKSPEIKINQGDIIVQGSMDKSVLPMVKQMLKDNSREIADIVGKEFSRAAGLSGIRSKKYI